ncbi:JAB domain-containing protein [Alkaliphilus oremlandii]|uniref:DNA repair protein RadC n=1 Tax=Alkaliphilus oremlandii (strain OhILAs) TaxID=350688 RepID=A8MGD7_ALKOO|nr:JAB domain-containing protein [Alkaliphilus oremlandii]ABW18865.1 DNA repair protein RadC [Alkaliphilus oremlandii OhILAs]
MEFTEIPVVRLKIIKEYDLKISDRNVYSADEAGPIFEDFIGGATLERLALLCIDSSNYAINVAILNIGNNKNVEVVPSEIFKIALLSNATSIIICHNHPSGLLEPSQYDIEVTKKIGRIGYLLGIKLIDSMIMGYNGEYFSMRNELKKAGEKNDSY